MTKQPEALRLAELLDTTARPGGLAQEAAAELRRLHEVNQELLAREKRWMELADIEVARCDKLQAVNRQLLEALDKASQYLDATATCNSDKAMAAHLRAAIAAAKEQA